MRRCACPEPHPARRIVLTGGPGAGKTAVLELTRHYVCGHVAIVPESAGVVFGGGFPRASTGQAHLAAQRAIFYVQRELEAAVAQGDPVIALCDRGTVDCAAYWSAPDPLWDAVGTTLEAQLARYDTVIHLRTPSRELGYNHDNPLRIESAEEAAAIDERLLAAWSKHPRRVILDATPDFLDKARAFLRCLRAELPACCGEALASVC